LDLLPILALKR
jgi:hypothetical protein